MRALIQRVTRASVSIDGKTKSWIENGLVVLLGVGEDDNEKQAETLAEKTVNLRIMNDKNRKMNISVKNSGGEMLVISQFTLFADCKKGRRPSFIKTAKPEKAEKLYNHYMKKLREYGIKTIRNGEFGAYMTVEIVNDGPVTILLDSDKL